jgi:hypothetical protein
MLPLARPTLEPPKHSPAAEAMMRKDFVLAGLAMASISASALAEDSRRDTNGAPPPSAARHAFAPLASGDRNVLSYWDASGVVWSQAQGVISVLRVARNTPDRAWLYAYRVSCDWRSVELLPAATAIDPAGKETPFPLPADVVGKEFPDGQSAFGQDLDAVCGAGPPPQGLPSAAAAVALARENFRQEAAKQTSPPRLMMKPITRPAPAGFQTAPMRLGLVANRDGNLLFLDWAGLNRKDGNADAQAIVVLGAGVRPGAGAIMARQTHYACKARQMAVEYILVRTRQGADRVNTSLPGLSIDTRSSPLMAQELAAACHGKPPATVFENVNAALAYAATVRPEGPR